jgi:hypothetical protein
MVIERTEGKRNFVYMKIAALQANYGCTENTNCRAYFQDIHSE